jgi:hypothetical protein
MGIKRDRSIFLYLDPKPPEDQFAQCDTCMMYTGKPGEKVATCTIHGKEKINGPDGTCGLYVHGKPMPGERGHEMASVTKKESGYVERQVRCENCVSFNAGRSTCMAFDSLNIKMPQYFSLKTKVDPKGCCNAQTPNSNTGRWGMTR